MANKDMKRYSKPFLIREVQIHMTYSTGTGITSSSNTLSVKTGSA